MRIGLIPMSAKPYHAGHHALVQAASRENDRVLLFVSTSDRKRKGEVPISGADMMRVWKEHLEPILPTNTSVFYGGSPVHRVYEVLSNADSSSCPDTYTVYSDPVDTVSNYPDSSRMRYFPQIHAQRQVIFAAEERPKQFTRGVGMPDMSGTRMREALMLGDFEAFQRGLPDGVDASAVFDILGPKLNADGTFLPYALGLL